MAEGQEGKSFLLSEERKWAMGDVVSLAKTLHEGSNFFEKEIQGRIVVEKEKIDNLLHPDIDQKESVFVTVDNRNVSIPNINPRRLLSALIGGIDQKGPEDTTIFIRYPIFERENDSEPQKILPFFVTGDTLVKLFEETVSTIGNWGDAPNYVNSFLDGNPENASAARILKVIMEQNPEKYSHPEVFDYLTTNELPKVLKTEKK